MSVESGETPIQTFYAGPLFDPLGMREGLDPVPGVPSSGLAPGSADVGELGVEDGEWSFALDPERSFFGDCIRVVDVPDEQPLAPGFPPFGWSGKQLLDGYALTASRLRGELRIVFGARDEGRVPFAIALPSPLRGDSSALTAPDGWRLESEENEVREASPRSRGSLDPTTGRVYDFHFNCAFWNTAIAALLAVNPDLVPPPLLFPGLPHAGHALAWFAPDGEHGLRFNLAAQTFLPLGPGAPLVMPASAAVRGAQAPFPARNSSLHPFVCLSCVRDESAARTRARQVPRRTSVSPVAALLEERQNTTLRLRCLPLDTFFGDDFDVRSEDLGGAARAQSPLFGVLEIQLGEIVGDALPFTLGLAAPSDAYLDRFENLLRLLPPGTKPGLVGLRGDLDFPAATYEQRSLSLSSDPYKPSVGVIDASTGEVRGLVLRKYLFQELMLVLLMTEPRTPTDSFAYLCSGRFEAQDGALALDLDGALHIPYPAGYRFPLPDGSATEAGDGSQLTPFLRFRAVDCAAFQPFSGATIRFVGSRHVRGRRCAEVAFGVELDEGRATAGTELALDGERLTGRGPSPVQARYDDRLSIGGELVLGEAGVCTYHLTTYGAEAELQVVSADEGLDLWFAGEAIFG